jgi:hypothetical protein
MWVPTGTLLFIGDSLFFATEAVIIFQWSRTSDRMARKPLLIFGMVGTILSMLLWGLSRTFSTIVGRLYSEFLRHSLTPCWRTSRRPLGNGLWRSVEMAGIIGRSNRRSSPWRPPTLGWKEIQCLYPHNMIYNPWNFHKFVTVRNRLVQKVIEVIC